MHRALAFDDSISHIGKGGGCLIVEKVSVLLRCLLSSLLPSKVTVGSLELSANKDIQQVIEIVEDFGKYRVLAKHLQVKN